MENPYIYSDRAVAFLDVLGFKNKLIEFEDEAKDFQKNSLNHEVFDGDGCGLLENVFFSVKANEFIKTFNDAVSKLDPNKFSWYLFSDNICITAKAIDAPSTESLMELLLVVAELYFEFVQKGYFLRGGIDYGLFIDKAAIAVGTPLAHAVEMEKSIAVYPRVVLSQTFIKQFEVFETEERSEMPSLLVASLNKDHREINYLNVFVHIFKVSEKEDFFTKYQTSITDNLRQQHQSESIYLKYQWLAKEFNSFIDDYVMDLVYIDENFEPTEDYLENIKQLKISYE